MFSEMKVSTRLALAFGLVLVLLVGVVGLGISRMARVNEGLRTITEENNAEMNHATSMRAAAFQTSISLRNMMLMTDADKLKAEDVILHKAFHEFDSQADALEKMFQSIASTTPTEKDLLASVKKQWQALIPEFEKTEALGQANKKEEAYKYYVDVSGASRDNAAMRDTLEQLAAYEEKLSDEESARRARRMPMRAS